MMPPSAPEVTAYFSALTPAAEHEYREHVDGGDRLHITSYLTNTTPPERYVRSVRCVVLHGQTVLALRGKDYAHVLPGGKREPGETLLQTLERELLEEAGWTVTAPRQIGVVRLNWRTPRSEGWQAAPHFYPDFLWLIHAAEAHEHHPTKLVPEPDEEPIFLDLADPNSLAPLDRSRWHRENRVFLSEALAILRERATDPDGGTIALESPSGSGARFVVRLPS